MRDYNSIPFRSPRSTGKKQSQLQQPQQHRAADNIKNIKGKTSTSSPQPLKPVKSSDSGNKLSVLRSSSASPSSQESIEEKKVDQSSVASSVGSHGTHPETLSVQSGSQQQQQQQRSINTSTLSASDGLAVRREGAEATIGRLRAALEESSQRDAAHKTNLAKSEAMILELRSSVRQLKRQLEQREREQQENQLNSSTASSPTEVAELQMQLDRAHAQIITADMVRKELEDTLEAEQYTWELRVQDQERTIEQLSRECAQLADDLQVCRTQWKEAEQTWNESELVRQLERAQQEAQHWKNVSKSSSNQNGSHPNLHERLLELEQERSELQGCLDEALKELEAVDAELAHDQGGTQQLRDENDRLQKLLQEGDAQLVEQLQHLYRWVVEELHLDDDNESVHSGPRNSRELLAALRSRLEHRFSSRTVASSSPEMQKRVEELEKQISVYRGDLQAREESSAELRASLKEAVALLKPLQDAVAKADKDKAQLQAKLDEEQEKQLESTSVQDEITSLKEKIRIKDEEIDSLNQKQQTLEFQLSRANIQVANAVMSQQQNVASNNDHAVASSSKAREELRAKRATEKTLKQLLHDAQSRFQTLRVQQQEIEEMNHQLQDRLREAEEKLEIKPSNDSSEEEDNNLEQIVKEHNDQVQDLKNQLAVCKGELTEKEIQVRNMQLALEDTKHQILERQKNEEENALKMSELEANLSQARQDLVNKKSTEKALNKSLREALGLIKPLQQHLEAAENEKRDMAKEIHALRFRLRDSGSTIPYHQKSSVPSEIATIKELEATVKQLEKENSQLHDALEEMSQSVNQSHISASNSTISKNQQQKHTVDAEASTQQEVVTLQNRNGETQKRLEDAYVENHALVEALNKRESEQGSLLDEVAALRQQLNKTQGELDNAKLIATSALVKVEELEQKKLQKHPQFKGFDPENVYNEKARQLDEDMELLVARGNRSVPYRLT